MTANSKRLVYVDIIKTIAMLWIVGFWHLKPYVGLSHVELTFWWNGYVTNVFLGAFMFFSGFCLSKYRFDHFKSDVVAFYKKRFIRFYPLYLLSLLSLYCILYYQGLDIGGKVLITSMLGVSSYILPQPPTLWFFSMLISFYAVTPLILVFKKKLQQGGAILFFFLLGILENIYFPMGIDNRFFWYYPIYTLGLFFGKYMIIDKFANFIFAFALPISIGSLLYMYKTGISYVEVCFLQFAFILGSLMVLIWLIKKTSTSFFWKPILSLSSCLMCAYLFHRQVYAVIYPLYLRVGLDFGYWFTAIAFIPICLAVSYFIQKQYDRYFTPWLSYKLHVKK